MIFNPRLGNTGGYGYMDRKPRVYDTREENVTVITVLRPYRPAGPAARGDEPAGR